MCFVENITCFEIQAEQQNKVNTQNDAPQHVNSNEPMENCFAQKKVYVRKQPFLKRKSIRVDLALKASTSQNDKKIFNKHFSDFSATIENAPKIQEKPIEPSCGNLESSEMKQMEYIQALLREKKQLESELSMMKGRVAQLEEMYYETRNFYKEELKKMYSKSAGNVEKECCKKTQSTESQPKKIYLKSANKKKSSDSLEECSKCHKHFKNKYMKYHDRVCGNLKLKNLLSERDLIQLETAKLNMQNTENLKYVFDWRKRSIEFKQQVEQAKLRKGFMVFYKKK